MSNVFFFSCPKELSLRALNTLTKGANISVLSIGSDLTVEETIILDQLRDIVPKANSEDLGMVFDLAVYRSYIYLQWLNILGLDISLKLDDIEELADVFQEYDAVQKKLEDRLREFAKVRSLLN